MAAVRTGGDSSGRRLVSALLALVANSLDVRCTSIVMCLFHCLLEAVLKMRYGVYRKYYHKQKMRNGNVATLQLPRALGERAVAKLLGENAT